MTKEAVKRYLCLMCLADGDKTDAVYTVDGKAYCRRCAQTLIRNGGHGPAIPIGSDLVLERNGKLTIPKVGPVRTTPVHTAAPQSFTTAPDLTAYSTDDAAHSKQRRLTPEGKHRAITELDTPVAVLAAELGVTKTTIYHARKNAGLPASTAPTSDTVRHKGIKAEEPPRVSVVRMEDVPRVRPRKQSFLLPFWAQLKALESGEVLKLEFSSMHRANYTRNKLGKWAQAEGYVIHGFAELTTRYLWLTRKENEK